MNALGSSDGGSTLLATAVATPRQKRIALAVAAAALAAFAVAVPFVRVPLARLPAFIPAYEAALICIDLVTALLLYEQCARLRSAAVLVLASAYLFDALIIVPHALTFPGAFAPAGLLGARDQTTAWLYVFWHGGFPSFVLAYVWLARREAAGGALRNVPRAIALSAAAVVLLVAALLVWTTLGHDTLPVIVKDGQYSLLVSKGVSPAVWLITLTAMLMLWPRRHRAVDLWLMVVMWIWLFDIALSAVISSARFDLGWYAGRVFGLMASSFLLITLFVEMAVFYAGLVGQAAEAERRYAELARTPAEPGQWPAPKRVRATSDAFIIQQNIANYRARLAEAGLDAVQRQAIEALLVEEEAKLRNAGGGRP
jgi:hypothetical protein